MAAVFLFSMILAGSLTPAEAAGKHSPDLRITSATIPGGTLTMTVAGTAGATTPTEATDIYAYVFNTDLGLVGVTSHFGTDDPPTNSPNLVWHAHFVTLDASGCVTGFITTGVTSLSGNTLTVTGTGATSLGSNPIALSAVLSANDEGNICVKHVFSAI